MNIDIKKVKLITTVPVENIEALRHEVWKAGAGIIGKYTHCSTSTKCIGTFKPTAEANPYSGSKNIWEFVEGVKLEVVCVINLVKDVVLKLREAHPYSEPGIDIIPLIDESAF